MSEFTFYNSQLSAALKETSFVSRMQSEQSLKCIALSTTLSASERKKLVDIYIELEDMWTAKDMDAECLEEAL